MAEKEGQSTRNMDNSIDEDVHSDADENGLNSSSGSETETQSKKARMQTSSPNLFPPGFMVAASPPKFMSFDQLMSAANGIKNMALAHEIAVDNNFEITKLQEQPNGIHKQVREVMHKAFWDSLESKLEEDPPNYSHAIVLIKEVKENLVALLMPQHVRFREQIDEVLDIDLIEQKMANGAFDLFYYADYVISVMSKLCAPVRDEKISELKETKRESVPLFKGIFDVLELMKMDMANFTIQQIRPYLKQQSTEYERKKFQEHLKLQEDHNVDGLQFTKSWLHRNFQNLKKREAEAFAEGAAPVLATPAAIMNEAYMEVLDWDEGEVFPETLLMDQRRFMDLRDKTRRMTLVSSILLVTYNTVGAPISGVQSLKEKLNSEISVILDGVADKDVTGVVDNVADQVNKSVDEYMKNHGFGQRDDNQHQLLAGQIRNVAQMGDQAVYKIMSKRVMTFIHTSSFMKLTEPLKVPAGFSVVEKGLIQVCGQFLCLISHNRSVFGSYYAGIIGALLNRGMEDLSPRK
ncbi:hypothetical protein ScPMuIL_013271 [Solemya velum]